MKEPIAVPCWGYTWNEEAQQVEAHRIIRYGVLEGCSSPSMSCKGPDGRPYLTSPGRLKDTKVEVLEEELQDTMGTLKNIGEQLEALIVLQQESTNRLALLGKLLKEQK
jgi:hypothetical protein